MKAKLITAGLFFALASVASAGEPMVLSKSQMDSVTAGEGKLDTTDILFALSADGTKPVGRALGLDKADRVTTLLIPGRNTRVVD